MAKKETIPTIIDTPEALTAKMAAMKEAQKIFATYTQEQVDKIFKAAATAADKSVSHLPKWLLRKQAWVSWKTRLSRTITQQSMFTMHIRTLRHVVL